MVPERVLRERGLSSPQLSTSVPHPLLTFTAQPDVQDMNTATAFRSNWHNHENVVAYFVRVRGNVTVHRMLSPVGEELLQ